MILLLASLLIGAGIVCGTLGMLHVAGIAGQGSTRGEGDYLKPYLNCWAKCYPKFWAKSHAKRN